MDKLYLRLTLIVFSIVATLLCSTVITSRFSGWLVAPVSSEVTLWATAATPTPDPTTKLNPCQLNPTNQLPIGSDDSGSQVAVLDKLNTALQKLIANYQSQGLQSVGLVVKDQTSQQTIQVNADQVFVSGSLYKLFVLWKLQVEISAGHLSDNTEIPVIGYDEGNIELNLAPSGLSDVAITPPKLKPLQAVGTITIDEARRQMITYSDNTAAWSLAQVLDWNRIDELLVSHNFSVSRTARLDPITNANEITRLFEGLYNHNLDPNLSNKDYELMLSLLKAQQINIYISPGLPSGMVFAHKTGSWDNFNHDAGIIYTPDGRAIFLTILTEGSGDAAVGLMQEVARQTWQTMGQAPLPRYFPKTGKTVSGKFLEYWMAKGGLESYGYPLTEARSEIDPLSGKARLVQWFERARFELSPENVGTPHEVELGLLGLELCSKVRYSHPYFLPAPPLTDSSTPERHQFFTATGHNLSSHFLDFWEQRGGLSRFGYPISEEHDELDPDSGQVYRVQWFERARFELHPENADTPYEVLLGLLGRQALAFTLNP